MKQAAKENEKVSLGALQKQFLLRKFVIVHEERSHFFII